MGSAAFLLEELGGDGGAKHSIPGLCSPPCCRCRVRTPSTAAALLSHTEHGVLEPARPGKLSLPQPALRGEPLHRGHSPAPHQCSDTLKGLFLLHSGGKSTPNKFKMCLF